MSQNASDYHPLLNQTSKPESQHQLPDDKGSESLEINPEYLVTIVCSTCNRKGRDGCSYADDLNGNYGSHAYRNPHTKYAYSGDLQWLELWIDFCCPRNILVKAHNIIEGMGSIMGQRNFDGREPDLFCLEKLLHAVKGLDPKFSTRSKGLV